ncbi:PP2C family protein-serine/threonine phosphatase [Streptomyces echinoruber]|uniref:PP2C family protein-serine/threonine phosphatase n=1 Tax=Streptomyces echinoruber TaxID=68898 RepID=UPI00361C2956
MGKPYAPWRRRDGDRRGWLRGAPPPRWVRVLPVALVAGVAVAELTDGPLDIGFLLGAVPPLAVLAYGPLVTALLGSAVITVLTVPAFRLDRPGNTDLLTLSFLVALSAFVSFVRSRRDEQLGLERTVAEAVQRAVVPAGPRRVGAVRCAGLYRAAQRGTLVGGDFFDVREGPYGVRAVLGDVQGHGLAAVATVVSLLGAFREAVLDLADLGAVAGRLDRRLATDAQDVRYRELFATAVLLEFSADGRTARMLTCGHPPPVLLRGGTAVELELEPCPPLGLGLFGAAGPPDGATVRLDGRDVLLLASDGVTEARDATGAFYPLVERLPALARDGDPAVLAERVWADLVRYCGGARDDVTMLVLRPAERR